MITTYLGLGVVLFLYQDNLVFQPDHAVIPIAEAFPGGSEVQVVTDDGLELRSWYITTHHNVGRSPAVLLLHGNATNRSHAAPLALQLSSEGFHVLVLEYRGFGGNPGTPSEAGLTEDARAGLRWLRSREEVDPDRIAYLGESLGTAVAVALAVEQPPAALVLRSPFTSIPDVAWNRFPICPYSLLVRNRFDTAARIGEVNAPLLVLAASQDDLVPPSQSQLVYEHAGRPERYVEIEGIDHYSPELSTGRRFLDPVLEFLTYHLRPTE